VPWASISVYEVGQRGALAGPFEVRLGAGSGGGGGGGGGGDDEDGLLSGAVGRLPEMGYSHMCYACVKP
jgi:hypothetical protein